MPNRDSGRDLRSIEGVGLKTTLWLVAIDLGRSSFRGNTAIALSISTGTAKLRVVGLRAADLCVVDSWTVDFSAIGFWVPRTRIPTKEAVLSTTGCLVLAGFRLAFAICSSRYEPKESLWNAGMMRWSVSSSLGSPDSPMVLLKTIADLGGNTCLVDCV